MTAGTFLGGRVSVAGDFAVVDDLKVLQILIERCRQRNVSIIDHCALLNLRWKKESIESTTTKEIFSSRIVLDATGGGSPIASAFRLHRIDGFYAVYGGLLHNINLHSDDIVLGHVEHLGDPCPIFEVVPTSQSSAYCVIFVFTKTLVTPNSLATAFERHCRHNPFFTLTKYTCQIAEKTGVIPIGRVRRRRLPGIVSLGEAGFIQPPLMGTAFNEILEYSHSICECISKNLERDHLVCQLSSMPYPVLKRLQDSLQLAVARTMMRGNVELFDKTLRVMNGFPEEIIFKFFSNELAWRQLVWVATRLPLTLAFMREDHYV
ncbi:hypothetical protein [Rhodoplanes sp.]|uniref:hypothetical protein n=1 Tax=Rhodoplanes sp. TaxID=1968906 RepID=UPI0025DF7551|nr:hypothetical protein [Rhodoplanes sp.]